MVATAKPKRHGREAGSPRIGAPRLRSGRASAVTGLAFLLGALLLTWPMPLHVASRIPLGSEPTPAVPYFNLWTLGWNAHWFQAPAGSYWDAPIFHPTPGAFALSDPQPLTGLMAMPFWWIDRAFAYNAVLLLFLTLDGVTGRRLLLHRGATPAVAFVGGLLCQLLPFLTHERGVLQLQPIFGLVWALDETWRVVEGSSWRRGWALAAAIVATFATSEYYGLFLLVLCGPAVLFNLRSLRLRSAVLGLTLGITVAGAVITPLLWSQARQLRRVGLERSRDTVERYSASPDDYARPSPWTVSGALLRSATSHRPGQKFLSPGWAPALLALLGIAAAQRRPSDRRFTRSLLLAVVLAFLLSLGPRLALGGWQPYLLAEASVPGLAALRSPFRLAVLAQLGVALLAALGLDALKLAKKRSLAVVGTVLIVAELAPLPARLSVVPATIEVSAQDSPVVFIPFVEGSQAGDYLPTVAVMNALLPGEVRLVNGYSGFFPLLNSQLKGLLADFPTEDGLRALRSLGVRTVLVRLAAIDARRRGRLASLVRAGELDDLGELRELRLLRLEGAAFRPATDYRGRWAAGWRRREGRLELQLTPLDLGERMFVSVPSTAPLRWRARWTGSGGAQGEAVVSAKGTFLLYADGGYRPRITLPLPNHRESYRVELFDEDTGEPVVDLRLPPQR